MREEEMEYRTFTMDSAFTIAGNSIKMKYSWKESAANNDAIAPLGGKRAKKIMTTSQITLDNFSIFEWKNVPRETKEFIVNGFETGITTLLDMVNRTIPLQVKHNARVLLRTGKREMREEWYSIVIDEAGNVVMTVSYEWANEAMEALKKHLQGRLNEMLKYTTTGVVQELSKQGIKITPRMIKNYIDTGLLDAPKEKTREGRATLNVFSTQQLQRIMQIIRLQSSGHSLKEVKNILKTL